mmetsp:Transcript_29287/g.93268  ORF Transcript_29287/g.93268 Transcript_29287/m.93268 type:complete len:125 (+) Transcript_29287:50-424(+)|eukprot:scaffold912_cov108-Isochrysis_galbana.AAC.13
MPQPSIPPSPVITGEPPAVGGGDALTSSIIQSVPLDSAVAGRDAPAPPRREGGSLCQGGAWPVALADVEIPPTAGVLGLDPGRESLCEPTGGGAGRSPRVGGRDPGRTCLAPDAATGAEGSSTA